MYKSKEQEYFESIGYYEKGGNITINANLYFVPNEYRYYVTGWSPLSIAINKDDSILVKKLLNEKTYQQYIPDGIPYTNCNKFHVNVYEQVSWICTYFPLHYAVIRGNIDVIRILLDNITKEQLLVKDSWGNIPSDLTKNNTILNLITKYN